MRRFALVATVIALIIATKLARAETNSVSTGQSLPAAVLNTNFMSAAEAERAVRQRLESEHSGGGTNQVRTTLICRHCPLAEYPYEARKRREEGYVIIRAYVGEDGKIASAKISKSSGHTRLDEAALRAVKKWELAPKMTNGVPVATAVDVPMRFDMEVPKK